MSAQPPQATASQRSESHTSELREVHSWEVARPPGRLALSKAEAAEALGGVSLDLLEQHVLPELRVVRVGRRVLIPVRELEAWIERNAALLVEVER